MPSLLLLLLLCATRLLAVTRGQLPAPAVDYVPPPPGIFTTDASFAADTHEIVEDTARDDVYSLQELASVPAEAGFRGRLKPYAQAPGEFHMKPVRVIHARAVADMPVYDSIYNRFISRFGDDTSVKGYTAAMDTVTTASVAGVMQFLQTQVVNQFGRTVTTRCRRTNDIQFIVFYELLLAQPNASLALYQEGGALVPEYGPFVAMDHGRCTPEASPRGEDTFPDACLQINGNANRPRVGAFVGATKKDTEMRGLFTDAYWFSFPHTCPLQPWTAKTAACRTNTQRGLCPPGKLPDGVACTYAHNILGFLPLDDLVGITAMVNDATGRPFANFSEFCRFGGVELAQFDPFGYVMKALPFWEFPTDAQANAKRTQAMLDAYARLTSPNGSSPQIYFRLREKMHPLPSVDELSESNPPCYETVRACGVDAAPFGCKRETYAQICRVCPAPEQGCVKAPPTFVFPPLATPEAAVAAADATSRGSSSDNEALEPQERNGTRSADDSDRSVAAAAVTAHTLANAVLSLLALLVVS